MNRHLSALLVLSILALSSGCSMMGDLTKVATSIAVATGTMSADHAKSLNTTAEAGQKAAEKITPSQEYYVGRSIAANVLTQNKPVDNAALAEYLNTLGQTIAKFSDKPHTHRGYRFVVMNTDEINAFAAPGGFILVSKGLIKACKNEDELAAVLAHEVGHIEKEHAIRAIKASRWTSFWTIAGTEATKSLAGADLAEGVKIFEDSLKDIMDQLVVGGYDRKLEYEADAAAVRILQRMGYNPVGLKNMLLQIDAQANAAGKKGFFATHPDPKDRIKELEPLLAGSGEIPNVPKRSARFQKAVKGL